MADAYDFWASQPTRPRCAPLPQDAEITFFSMKPPAGVTDIGNDLWTYSTIPLAPAALRH